MTLEITHSKSEFTFRILVKDPCVIERRVNRNAARWYFYERFETPEEAKQALLTLQQGEKRERTS